MGQWTFIKWYNCKIGYKECSWFSCTFAKYNRYVTIKVLYKFFGTYLSFRFKVRFLDRVCLTTRHFFLVFACEIVRSSMIFDMMDFENFLMVMNFRVEYEHSFVQWNFLVSFKHFLEVMALKYVEMVVG